MELNKDLLPKHIAIIMDGNGRWAKKKFLPRNHGHQVGAKRLKEIALYCNSIGIKYLTVYAFSTENWNRPQDEVDYLMNLPIKYFKENQELFHSQNIKISFIGSRDMLKSELIEVIEQVENLTKDNTGLNLIIAFNYGGRREILDAVVNIMKDNVPLEKIDEALFQSYLYTKNIPDVDLMIRTSGEERLSNFLLWQNSYSEFVFTKTLWPDFKEKNMEKILLEYNKRDRRFGGIKNA